MLLVSNASAFSLYSKSPATPTFGFGTEITTPAENKNVNVAASTTQLSSMAADAPSDVESPPGSDNDSDSDSSPFSPVPLLAVRNDLLRTAQKLTKQSPTGVFLSLPADRAAFMKAVARLEAISPTTSDESEAQCLGNWTLLATSRRTPLGKTLDERLGETQKDKGPNTNKFQLPKFDAAAKLQESITVTQRIRTSNPDEDEKPTIDRIDNIIEFDNTLNNFLPAALNPFQIDKSKAILVHTARVETFVPFRTKMSLTSVILNVAGTNQQLKLDPDGADVLGLNIPSLSEWMNSGGFDTTFVDENVRVSRGTIGLLEETRVFVREGSDLSDIISMASEVEEEEEHQTQLDKIASAVGDVAVAVGDLTKDVKDTIEKDAEVVKGDIETAVQEMKEVVEEDLKGVSEAVEKVKSAVINDEGIEEAVDNVASAVGDLGKDVTETVVDAVNEIKSTVEDDTKKIQEAVEDVRDKVLDEKKDVEDETKDGVAELSNNDTDEKKKKKGKKNRKKNKKD